MLNTSRRMRRLNRHNVLELWRKDGDSRAYTNRWLLVMLVRIWLLISASILSLLMQMSRRDCWASVLHVGRALLHTRSERGWHTASNGMGSVWLWRGLICLVWMLLLRVATTATAALGKVSVVVHVAVCRLR